MNKVNVRREQRAAKNNYKQCKVGRAKRREREGGTWERKILSLGR